MTSGKSTLFTLWHVLGRDIREEHFVYLVACFRSSVIREEHFVEPVSGTGDTAKTVVELYRYNL